MKKKLGPAMAAPEQELFADRYLSAVLDAVCGYPRDQIKRWANGDMESSSITLRAGTIEVSMDTLQSVADWALGD
jgi:hypothetical protein